ncbi:unnamed protein product [Phytomonas sp. Hart1]|nr:unnamed protein product [Phytomonas sp. Hart1]|eukprot:CCW70260.1 unnamed protein product [Phytomonas sp. isolate Hart1]
MLGLRDVHEGGTTRVAIDGDHVLTGGADGVVALFPIKRWPQSASLWARQCHESGVSYVILHDALHLALSCGRDGKIVLHENINETGDDANKSTSRVICRVTGEVRCLYFDAVQQRLFVGGDSLRCLHMTGNRMNIQTIPLPIPHPLVALALSPCGRLLAVANAGGTIAVIGVVPPAASPSKSEKADPFTQSETQLSERELLEVEMLRKVRFIFHNILSPSAKREDACTYRMQWCQTSGGAVLAIPTATEVLIYQVSGDFASLSGYQMRCMGGLHGEKLMDFHSVGLYPLSSQRMMCVMASQEGLYMAKVSNGKLAMTHHHLQKYDSEHSITDMQVNERTGDVVVGLLSGKVSLLHRVAPKSLDTVKTTMPQSSKEKHHIANAEGDTNRDAETVDDDEGSKTIDKRTKAKLRKERVGHFKRAPSEKDFINDASTSTGSRDGMSDADGSSSETNSVSGTDASEEEVEEDLEKVVRDLKRHGTDFTDVDGTVRSSRWRKEDPRRVVASIRRQPSRFLDDEAEEASSGDADEEDEMASQEDGYGERVHRHHTHEMDDSKGGVPYEGEGGSDACDRSSVSAQGTTAGSPNDVVAASMPRHSPMVRDYSFQVGATPPGDEGSCYLAYNSVGFIRCTRDAATVHFHDISHPAVRINENGVILMGTLSPVGVGFVVLPSDVGGDTEMIDSVDDAPRLVVYFRTFVSLGAQSDWRVRLLPGETVRCMVAGIRFIAVATSRYLRLFLFSGLEIGVLSKFSKVVTMAGTSSQKLMDSYKVDFDPLAVVYLEGGELKMEVINVVNRSNVVPARVVPLTESSDGTTHELQWFGWSEDGPLHTADTAGVVRMYTESWGGSWVPVYDPRSIADSSTNLWIWGVNDKSLYAYRSSATAGSLYPAAVSGGLPTEHVPLFIPLTRTMNEKDLVTWDYMLRREIRTDELKLHSNVYTKAIALHDARHDNKLLGLFQWALQEQFAARAFDFATLMELRDNVMVCAKEANKKGSSKLMEELIARYDRLKTVSRRKCTLPLEGSVMSEKGRDPPQRKPLLKEKEDLQRGEPREATQHSPEKTGSGNITEAAPTKTKPTSVGPADFETPNKQLAGANSVKTLEISPSSKSVTTATTITTVQSPPMRQRVTFKLPSGGSNFTADTQSTLTQTTATTTTTTAEVRKSAPAPSSAPAAKPTNPFTRSTPGARAAAPPAAAPSPPIPTRVDVLNEPIELIGGSQPVFRAAGDGGLARPPTGPPRTTFLAAAVPSPALGVRGKPVDPFLRRDQEEVEEGGGGLTVQAVLGKEDPDAESSLPPSNLFGEALRKRYREDDDVDGQQDELALPALAVPRIA